MNKCLYCYQPLTNGEIDFHAKCSKRFFGVNQAPVLSFGQTELEQMAQKVITQSIAVTGVQPKLSLSLEKVDASHNRLTIVGLWGDYILKPPTEHFPQLPENEDLTMKLAALCGIKTAEHTLMRLASGELAYLTKRFDRIKGKKVHVEDLCQLTQSQTEHKYRSSMEKVGKAIRAFSSNRGLDALSFFEMTIFCFLTGNADMHLKNFSLMKTPLGDVQLSPAYDLVSTKLAILQDLEEIALTMNGKKNRLKKTDFDKLGDSLEINEKARENIYEKFSKKINPMLDLISTSFLERELQKAFQDLIIEKWKVLETPQ